VSENSSGTCPAITSVQRRRTAFVGNVRHFDAGHALEKFAVEMMRRAGPAGCEGQHARMVLGVLHELRDRAHGQGRIGHEHEWNPAPERQRHESLIGS